MARLTGPDEGSRFVYRLNGNAMMPAVGAAAVFYTDASGTTLADIRDTNGNAVASTLTVDTYSRLPLFQLPDGVDTVYVSVAHGPLTPVYARTDDRLDALVAGAAAEVTARAAADAAALVAANGTYPSALASTIDAPALGMFFPEAHGAVGDGTTNDKAAWQAAIDACYTAGGGKVIGRAGRTYGIGGWTGAASNVAALYALRLKNGVEIVGNGFSTVLKALTGPGVGGEGIFVGNDQTNGTADVAVRNLTIDLSATNQASHAVGIGYGNPYGGAVGVTRGTIDRVLIFSVGFVGIRLTSTSSYCSVTNNIVHDIGFIGIQVDATTYSEILGNTVYNTANNGIDLSGDTGSATESTCSHNVVSGNVVRNATGATGIFIETASHNTIIGNTVDACGYGIYLNRSASLCRHNAVVGNTVSGCTVVGIQVNATCQETTITGNTIDVPATKIGVLVNAGYRVAITGNAIHGEDGTTTAHGVQFTNSTSYCTVTGNMFSWLTADVEVLSSSADIVTAANLDYGVTTRYGSRLGDDGGDKIGFFGHAPATQPARPTDTASIIAALVALGLTA